MSSSSWFRQRFDRWIPTAATLGALVPDIARGARAGVATLVPFYLAGALPYPPLTWMALGGWLGTLADPEGARAMRARVLVAFALAGGVAVLCAEAVSRLPGLSVILLVGSAFGLALLRAAGGSTATLGTLLLVTVAIATAANPHAVPLRDGALFTAGSGLAVILSSVVWPVWPHLPVRRALAATFDELSEYATAIEDSVSEGTEAGHERWHTIAREHQRGVRAAIESARAITLAVRARRSGESRTGAKLRVLLGMVETQFPMLIALAEEIESLPHDARDAHWREVLEGLSSTYSETRAYLVTGRTPERTPERAKPATPWTSPDGKAEARSADFISGRLVRASRATLAFAVTGDIEAVAEVGSDASREIVEPAHLLRDILVAIYDALSPRSLYFRHAIRVAIAAAVAAIAGAYTSPAHVPWVTVTALVILEPYPGATVKRAAERVTGTIVGSCVAIAIAFLVQGPAARSVVLFVLSIAAVATRPRSYRLFTLFITPIFVLLASKGLGDVETAIARAEDTVLGGAIALVTALLLFPSSDAVRLPAKLVIVLDRVADYVNATFDPVLAGASTRSADARREVGIALGEAEASLERLLSEPLRDRRKEEDAMLLVTYLRRLTNAITTLDTLAVTRSILPAVAPGALAAHAYVLSVLRYGRSRLEGGSPTSLPRRPFVSTDADPEVAHAVDRITRYAELMVGLAAASPPSATKYAREDRAEA